MTAEQATPLQDPGVDHKRVAALVFGFIGFVCVALAGLGVYFVHFERNVTISPPERFPAPQLETRHMQEIVGLRRAQKDKLQSYSWVARDQGIVRIPVARAMQIIGARGASAFDPFANPVQPSEAAP
jgi:hypothetical protein